MQFYTLKFLEKNAFVPANDAYMIVGAALLVAAPLFILVGHLSETYGRSLSLMSGQFELMLGY
jgi:hypothetical protein